MAKKFGKTLLLTAAAVSAAAAFYFYLQKKDAAQKESEEEDYDDFSEDSEPDTESSRSYVPLNHDAPTESQDNDTQEKQEDSAVDSSAEEAPEHDFTHLKEQIAQAGDNGADNVENFFDDEDDPGVEPPISDN